MIDTCADMHYKPTLSQTLPNPPDVNLNGTLSPTNEVLGEDRWAELHRLFRLPAWHPHSTPWAA